MTGNLANNSHAKFWVSTFSILQKWHCAYLWRAYSEAEGSLPIGYYLEFQPHLAQERINPHLNQNIMTLTFTFAPANQNILAWATFHFAILHHCIFSMLSCNQNTHCAQGPKSDYTHAYIHPLSNLLSFQLPLWSLSVICLLIFLVIIPAQLSLANQRHVAGGFWAVILTRPAWARRWTLVWPCLKHVVAEEVCELNRW